MPSLKDIRRSIASVKNTQKITRAMKLVSAAKLRRAQDAITKNRPYAKKVQALVTNVSDGVKPGAHPLLTSRVEMKADERTTAIVVLSSNRGLCGAFNSNILKSAEARRSACLTKGEHVRLIAVGKKASDYYRFRDISIDEAHDCLTTKNALVRSKQLADHLSELYVNREIDAVDIVFNEFKSAMSQRSVVEGLLPIDATKLHKQKDSEFGDDDLAVSKGSAMLKDYVFDPGRQAILNRLVPMYVEVLVYRAALETIASEHGSRMTAMDSATNNASDLLSDLSLQYNKARQASITRELLEIVAGAEALKGG